LPTVPRMDSYFMMSPASGLFGADPMPAPLPRQVNPQ
jgi:hypothetical protein